MSALTIYPTYQYTNGETLTAPVLNNPLAAIQAWSTTIDNTNLTGGAGIYASQIIPLNTAQSTFGGAVGYTIAPGSATQVPLTISGTVGQSVDVFDINDPVGTKVFGIAANGTAFAGTGPATGTGAGDFTVSESATAGFIALGNGTLAQTAGIAGVSNVIRFLPSNNAARTFEVNATSTISTVPITSVGAITAGSGTAGTTTAGSLWASTSTTTGSIFVGGSSASAAITLGLVSGAGNLDISPGAGQAITFGGGINDGVVITQGAGSGSISLNRGINGIGSSAGGQTFIKILGGSGVPTLSAVNGSLYLRQDGPSASTSMYVNTSGANVTGTTWTAVAIP